MAEITCKKCGLVNDYRTEMKSNQQTAWCNGCDSFIKNIPYNTDVVIYVGKYKGKFLKDVTDLSYLEWAVKNWRLSESVMNKYNLRIAELRLSYR